MRAATRIRNLAAGLLYLCEQHSHKCECANCQRWRADLTEIIKLAGDMDARTGTIDPTKKKGWHFPWNRRK